MAIEKIKRHISTGVNNDKFENILLKFNKKFNQKKITIQTEGKLVFLESKEIIFVASDGNYCTFHLTKNKKLVVTKKLKDIDLNLPDEHFFRVHNSYIINLNKIKEFLKTDGYVILENNHKIPVSRQKKSDFLKKL